MRFPVFFTANECSFSKRIGRNRNPPSFLFLTNKCNERICTTNTVKVRFTLDDEQTFILHAQFSVHRKWALSGVQFNFLQCFGCHWCDALLSSLSLLSFSLILIVNAFCVMQSSHTYDHSPVFKVYELRDVLDSVYYCTFTLLAGWWASRIRDKANFSRPLLFALARN